MWTSRRLAVRVAISCAAAILPATRASGETRTYPGDCRAIGVLNRVTFEDVQEISEKIIKRYEDGQVDAVYVIFNEFKSMIAQRLVVERLLPVPRSASATSRRKRS